MLKKIIIYGLGTFSSKLLVFLVLPIYTRVIAPSDYGYFDVILTDTFLVSSIAFVEIWSGILRYFIDNPTRENKLSILRSFYSCIWILAIFYIIGLGALSYVIEIKYWPETIICGAAYMMFNVSNCIARGDQKNKIYVISGMIGTTINCFFSLLFCVYLKLGVNYLLLATAFGYIFATIYVEAKLHFFRDAFHVSINVESIKNLIHFCLPLMVNSIAYSFLTMYNKNYILNNFGEAESGFYAIANKFAAFISIVTSIYQQAWQEESYLIYNNKENKKQLYAKNIELFICVVGFSIGIIILLIGLFFEWIVGDAYLQAKMLIPAAIWGVFFSTFAGVVGNVMGAEKTTTRLFLSTMIGGLFNVVCVNILGIEHRTQGVNFIILMSFALMTIVRYLMIKRKYGVVLKYQSQILLIFELLISIVIYMLDIPIVSIFTICALVFVWGIVNRKQIKKLMKFKNLY